MLRKLIYPSVVVVLPFVMYIQVWHGAETNRKFFIGDAGDTYFPDLRAIELALFDGQFPLWNPYDRGGFPFAADPQPGVLYPLNWLLAAIGHVQGGVSFGLMQFKLLLHLSIAGLSMYLFMRDRDQPRPAAAIAAVSYEFGAYFAHHAFFSLVWPLAWTPLLLRSLDRLFGAPAPRTALATAGYMALIGNAGSPPAVFYGAFIVLPYFGLRLAESLRGARWRPWIARTGMGLLFAGGVGVIFSLPQLLATIVLTKQSRLAETNFDHASSGSVYPVELLGLAIRGFSGLHWYAGICALFLACLGVLYYRERKEACVFAGLVVVGMMLMLGRETLLYRVAYDLIPGIDRFRLCFRYVALVAFGVPVLAAFGLTALLQRTVSSRAFYFFGACALLLALIVVNSPKPEARDPVLTRDILMVAILLGSAVAIAHGIYHQAQNRVGLCACLVALVTIDYGTVLERAGTLVPGVRKRPDYFTPAEFEQLRRDVSGYRIFNEFALSDRAGSRHRIRDLCGYFDPLVLDRYESMMFQQLSFHPAELMALFNVKYYLFSQHPEAAFNHHFVKNPNAVAGFKQLRPNLYEVKDPSPNAYWVGQITLRKTYLEVINELSTVDYHKTALVATKDITRAERRWAASLRKPARNAVAARVLGRGFNYATFSIDAPAEGLLVINEIWFPGWKAYVDGSETPLMRVNSLMQGLRVTPGSHHVELVFRPMYFLLPLAFAVLTAIVVAIGLALHARRR